ncbi:hypothetical protein EV652_109167 [Kribbella steppae]|uniref:Uncharacterized protein n=1 Tax=Kribbella steppae TaxID=2512223 RepID=A0A4R2HCD7_9ACTN|nr:hypothetical protein [Kribbella steppae]TCO23341.1 hypothetical protein EV652_109167 [Kribbella steppae]
MFPGEIDVQPSTYLEHLGTIFARFSSGTQGSGNISHGVRIADQRYPLPELHRLPPGLDLSLRGWHTFRGG